MAGSSFAMAGSSFAVGVGYVSRWYSMEHQGSAFGVYGLGNVGQSSAVIHSWPLAKIAADVVRIAGMSSPKMIRAFSHN
jgi:nitrate/nitrite transporter NarK